MQIFGKHILLVDQAHITAVHQVLKDAGHSAEVVVLNAAQQIEHALESSDIGVFIQSEISALTDSKMTTIEKFEAVVAKAIPFAITYLSDKHQISTEAHEIESAIRATVQGVFNVLFSKSIPDLFAKLAGVFGLK